MDSRPPSSATFTAVIVPGQRAANFHRCSRPSGPTRYTCSKNMCPNCRDRNAWPKCSSHDTRPPELPSGELGSSPSTRIRRSPATWATTSSAAPFGFNHHDALLIGSITAFRSDWTCASSRPIFANTRVDWGNRSTQLSSDSAKFDAARAEPTSRKPTTPVA